MVTRADSDLTKAATIAERDANTIIEQQLVVRRQDLESEVGADCLTYLGPIHPWFVDEIKDAVEAIANRRKALLVMLETHGGYMDVAERIARIFRHHYRRVEFLVPSFAMSAGTVLVMSGDAIHMDYSSVLGPIDPQIERHGELVPALGYLEQFDRLIQKAADGDLTNAETVYLVERFDPAELYRYEQERELSIAVLEEWLVKYKFKDWKMTESSGKKVTLAMKRDRAREVARKLNDTQRWHSHSRGIPMEVLRRDLKLLIDDFGADPGLTAAVHGYYRLIRDYAMKRGHALFSLHGGDRYVGA
jgi:hypothetical protein